MTAEEIRWIIRPEVEQKKMYLLQALIRNSDVEDPLAMVTKINVPLADKLQEIDLSWIREENVQTVEDLWHYVELVRYLRDISLAVCPHEGKEIIIPDIPAHDQSVFRNGSTKQGARFARLVMSKLGYNAAQNDVMTVLETDETDIELVFMVTADLMVATAELQMFYEGRHAYMNMMRELLMAKTAVTQGCQNDLPNMTNNSALNCSNGVYDIKTGNSKKNREKPAVAKKPPVSIDTFSAHKQAYSCHECDLCASLSATTFCAEEEIYKHLCDICDDKYHINPTRRHHKREPLSSQSQPSAAPLMRRKATSLVKSDRQSVVVFPGRKAPQTSRQGTDSSLGVLSQGSTGWMDNEEISIYLANDEQSELYYTEVDAKSKKSPVLALNINELDTMKEELDKIKDLRERKAYVSQQLEEVNQQLANFTMGTNTANISERIVLFRKHDFLKKSANALENELSKTNKFQDVKAFFSGIKKIITVPGKVQLSSETSCKDTCSEVYYEDVDVQSEALARNKAELAPSLHRSESYTSGNIAEPAVRKRVEKANSDIGQQGNYTRPPIAVPRKKPISPECLMEKYSRTVLPAGHDAFTPTIPAHVTEPTSLNDQEIKSQQMLEHLKAGNVNKFTVEEIKLAMSEDDAADPVTWLKSVWLEKARQVVTMATGKLRSIHPKAELSLNEARLALVVAEGHIDSAANIAFQSWSQMFEELLINLSTPSEITGDMKSQAVIAMNKSEGDIAIASQVLFCGMKTPGFLQSLASNEECEYNNFEMSMILPGYPSQGKPVQIVSDSTVDYQRRVRTLMAEFGLETADKASTVLKIWDRRNKLCGTISVADVIEAVKSCGTMNAAISYLQQSCAICMSQYPASKIQLLSFCQCKLCVGCLRQHFMLIIKEKQVRDLVCPACGKPDISNREQFEQHLQLLQMMLRYQLNPEIVDLFEKKLRDWVLAQDPNFKWCPYDDCGCGFIFNYTSSDAEKMECPDCLRSTCHRCKLPWRVEHVGINCEVFAVLCSENKQGETVTAAKLLQDHGIECPKCHFQYHLAKGGCIHFTCVQCGHDFCIGCRRPFSRGNCGVILDCSKQGLHCHHPRNCLAYLRDEPVVRLQKLLQDHNVSYSTSDPKKSRSAKCSLTVLQDNGRDEPCGRAVLKHQAELCEMHYKEYLVELINKHELDFVNIMNIEEMQNVLRRLDHYAPLTNAKESAESYKARLIEIIKKLDPLCPARQFFC